MAAHGPVFKGTGAVEVEVVVVATVDDTSDVVDDATEDAVLDVMVASVEELVLASEDAVEAVVIEFVELNVSDTDSELDEATEVERLATELINPDEASPVWGRQRLLTARRESATVAAAASSIEPAATRSTCNFIFFDEG
jgi:hypothetical protein